MTRHGSPPPGHIQKEPSGPLPDAEEVSETQAPIPTGWRVALFLWVTSFGFLLVYELLSALLKILIRR